MVIQRKHRVKMSDVTHIRSKSTKRQKCTDFGPQNNTEVLLKKNTIVEYMEDKKVKQRLKNIKSIIKEKKQIKKIRANLKELNYISKHIKENSTHKIVTALKIKRIGEKEESKRQS